MTALNLAAIEAENMAAAYGMAMVFTYLIFMSLVIFAVWISTALALLLNSIIAALTAIAGVVCYSLAFGWWHSRFLFTGTIENHDAAFSDLWFIMALYACVWIVTAFLAIAAARIVFKRRLTNLVDNLHF